MSIFIILLIMLACGLLGGLINYFLPANDNPDDGNKIKDAWQCLLMGIGATLLVPLFLEIANSRLLDQVYYSFTWQKPVDTVKSQLKTDTIIITRFVDTGTKKTIRTDTLENKKEKSAAAAEAPSTEGQSPAKNYLLYAAYCLVAAASGFRFINMLISNVVKDQTISKQQSQITNLKKAKEKRELNSQVSQQLEDTNVRREIMESGLQDINNAAIAPEAVAKIALSTWPPLPPVIHGDDPQKGRFGGLPARSGRSLKANVAKSGSIPEFYNVTIWVESDDPAKNPLNSDVIFYIHDSFSPSVYRITPAEFKDGKAVDDEILSYGAFTVGAIADNGATMLELDLSEDSRFPKKFRER